jgi:hypothetical protein
VLITASGVKALGQNTLRALTSNLGYLEAWALAAISNPPALAGALILKIIAHHLWDPAKREDDPSRGMPDSAEADLYLRGLLKVNGPNVPATGPPAPRLLVDFHQWRRLETPLTTPGVG